VSNREKMKDLCAAAGSYQDAARLITEQSKGRPLSVDAIKSWTCSEGTKRARACPDWAIDALSTALASKPK
jgi:hypothetical protein